MLLWTFSCCSRRRLGGGNQSHLRPPFDVNLLTGFVLWNAVLPSLFRLPSFVASVRHCRSDADCHAATAATGSATGTEQLCYHMYDGCAVGQCMCDPRRHTTDDRGRCVRLKDESDTCGASDETCRPGMQCRRGRCLCASGQLTPDSQYCLQAGERLLGQTCSTYDNNVCVHLGPDGYTRNEVSCSAKGRCECAEGYKSDSHGCKRRNINEYGCVRSHHCSGGAICSPDRWCTCPPGYRPVASNSKCAPNNAVTNIDFGANCDEINEERYCSSGLVCHRCPADGQRSKCVKFSMANEFSYLLSGAPTLTPSSSSAVATILFSVLLYVIAASLLVICR